MADEELYRRWGDRLRAERSKRGLTQRDLAARSGVSQQHVSGIERGLFGVGDDSRRALARALELRPVELFPYPEDLQPAAPAAAS